MTIINRLIESPAYNWDMYNAYVARYLLVQPIDSRRTTAIDNIFARLGKLYDK